MIDLWPDGTKVRVKNTVSSIDNVEVIIRGVAAIPNLCVMYICEFPSDWSIEGYDYNFVVIASSCLELI